MAVDNKRIIVTTNFSTEQRAEVLAALHDIENFKDGEGKELLHKAYKLRGVIKIFPTDGETLFSELNGAYIRINMTEMRSLVVKEAGHERHLSLTGVLVHELYHAADPMAQSRTIYTRINDWLLDEFKQKGVHHPLAALKELSFNFDLSEVLESRGEARKAFRKACLHRHLYAAAAALEHMPEGLSADTLMQACGVNVPGGTPRRERDATQFTDEIMHKNYGSAEPRRGRFENASTSAVPLSLLIIPKLTGNEFCTVGFQADTSLFTKSELHGNQPPTVKPYMVPGKDCGSQFQPVSNTVSNRQLGNLSPTQVGATVPKLISKEQNARQF